MGLGGSVFRLFGAFSFVLGFGLQGLKAKAAKEGVRVSKPLCLSRLYEADRACRALHMGNPVCIPILQT